VILSLPGRGPKISVWPPLPLPRTRLGQCLALALLLHLWLVLMIGTAPGGSAAPGEGVWGRLNAALTVTLTGPPSPTVEATPQAAPAPIDSGPTGVAPKRRQGGSVRPSQRPTPSPVLEQPGAAELGRWNATPSEQLNGPAPEAAAPEPEPTLRVQDAPPVTVQRLQKPSPPAPSRSNADKATPDLLKSLPAAAPVEAPPAPVPPPPDLRTLPEPEALPARRAPAELPTAVTPPVLQSQPLSAPKAQPQITAPPAPISASPTQPSPPQATPGTAPSSTSTPQPAAPSLVPVLPPVGAPDAGTQRGHDVATPPSASASAPRAPLDLRMPVNGPVARQNGTSVLNLMPHPPDAKAKLSEDMKKAGRGDCRDEHAGAGLLAVIPLAVDTARDKGCKW